MLTQPFSPWINQRHLAEVKIADIMRGNFGPIRNCNRGDLCVDGETDFQAFGEITVTGNISGANVNMKAHTETGRLVIADDAKSAYEQLDDCSRLSLSKIDSFSWFLKELHTLSSPEGIDEK
jgi:hypothetical protein